MEAELVLAPDVVLATRTFRQVEVAGGEREMKLELSREIPRDVAIARPRHTDVGFREEQEIGIAKRGMVAKGIDLPLELDPSLEIPCDHAVAILGRGLAAREAPGGRARKDTAHLRLEVAIERKRQELRGGPAPGKRLEVRLQLRPYEVVAHQSFMVPHRAGADWVAFYPNLDRAFQLGRRLLRALVLGAEGRFTHPLRLQKKGLGLVIALFEDEEASQAKASRRDVGVALGELLQAGCPTLRETSSQLP